MGQLLSHTDKVPALLEMNSWQKGDLLPASPALFRALLIFARRESEAVKAGAHHLNLMKL